MRFDITDIRKKVQWTGGTCLSNEYINDATPLKWRCKRGHTWECLYSNIRAGQWCVQCKKEDAIEEFISDCKEYARTKGGKFLTKTLSKRKEHATWRCANGHEWSACAGTVMLRKTWCIKCSHPSKLSIEDARKIATKRGGFCLSTSMENTTSKLKMQCELGHTWFTTLGRMRNGSWCKICSLKIVSLKNRIPFTLVQKAIKARKAKLLITESQYNDASPLVIAECAKGHIWKRFPYEVVRLKKGCPKCEAPYKPLYDIDVFKSIAKEGGGECLSKVYHGQRDELKWKCKKGHVFISRAINMKSVFRCPICEDRVKPTLKLMKQLAAEKKGWCLSTEYVSLKAPLQWKCKKGHVWNARPVNIKCGCWCPVCAGRLKFTLEQAKKIGMEYNCKLLSKTYVRSSAPLKWSCQKSHTFNRSLDRLRFLKGCPECRKQNR